MADPRSDLTRSTIGVVAIAALLGLTLWILRPFLLAGVWATMIVVASWPGMLWLERRLRGRRLAAVAVITGALLLAVVGPLTVAVVRLAGSADEVVAAVARLQHLDLTTPPAWLAAVPLVGARAAAFWTETAAADLAGLGAWAAPHAGRAAGWLLGEAGALGGLVVQFLLTVVITAILFTGGETAAAGALAFARRLAGESGENAVRLAGQAIRGVAMGVVVTAVVQTTLGGLGLAIAGVPFAGVLTAAVLLLCIAQIGPTLVMIPAVIWTFWAEGTGWGVFLLVWSIPVVTIDNVLRPVLIRMGADLPLLLIFAGVIGGLFAMGLVGVFVGPVVLAVAFRLLQAWVVSGGEPLPAALPARRAVGE